MLLSLILKREELIKNDDVRRRIFRIKFIGFSVKKLDGEEKYSKTIWKRKVKDDKEEV